MLHALTEQQAKPQTICVVAGKSGGHLIPALAYAQQQVAADNTQSVVVIHNGTQLDTTIMQAYPWVKATHVLACGARINNSYYAYPQKIYDFITGCIHSYRFLRQTKTTMIISTGGLIGLPVCIAGKLLGCTIALYELNSTPGKASRYLSYLADTIYCTFAHAIRFFSQRVQSRCQVINYPIRFTNDDVYDKATAYKKLSNIFSITLSPERFTLLILGGSQGSTFLNNLVQETLKHHPELHNSLQIIHQTGPSDTDFAAEYNRYTIPAITFSFSTSIAACYQAADIILSRAGAGTIFESLFFKKPSILIPLVTATTDHQVDNAHAIMQTYPDLFTVLEQDDIAITHERFALLLQSAIANNGAHNQ